MSTTSSAAQSTTSSTSANLDPESCISLASSLRCYYTGQSTEIHHSLLIIPVVLELIFSTSLVFICWHSGRRHLLLVAEGWIIFLLSLIEVFLYISPAVRESIPMFRALDELIGTLSFTQLLCYMSFLYIWVQGECFPIVPRKFRKITKLLLFMFIPTVMAMNVIASFVGVSYAHGPNHVTVTFRDSRARFVWPFFSSITLALFALFQASCFCCTCYRLILALLVQRRIEVKSKDAAVLFRGIFWINIGIKFGVIETVTGFLFFGIPIAYVRRALRMLSRAFLCIGVAKGVDTIEDFKALRGELTSKSLEWNLRRPKSREPVSGDLLSVQQSLPRITVPHTVLRESVINYNLHTSFNEKPHPYAASTFLTAGRHNSTCDQSPSHVNMEFPSRAPAQRFQKLNTIANLSGVSDFVETRTRGMHERSPGWTTTYHQPESPTSLLQRFRINLPVTPTINQIIENRHRTVPYTTRTLQGQPENQLSLYSVAPAHSDLNTHDRTPEFIDKSFGTFGADQTPTLAPYDHTQNFSQSSFELEPPTPAYLQGSTWRLSNASQTSDISAAQAEIVDVPRRMLSFTKYKPSLAKVVLHSVPETKTNMALVGGDLALTSEIPPKHLQKPRPLPPEMDRNAQPTLSTSHRLLPSRSPFPVYRSSISARSSGSQFTQQRAEFPVRESIIDEDDITPFCQDVAGKVDKRIAYNVDSVPEALKTTREFAVKIPGPPSEALSDFRTSLMTPVKERDAFDTVSEQSRVRDENVAISMRHRKISRDSMDTIEMLRTRIPAELKMKGRAVYHSSDIPLPPVPGQEVRQLPSPRPVKNALPLQPLRKLPTPESSSKPALAAKLIDSCDSETRSHAMPNEISSLSVLRHPKCFSTIHPVTRHDSGTTATFSSVSPSSHSPDLSSRSSSGAIDSYTTLNLRSITGQRTSGTYPMCDLPGMEIMEGFKRGSSVQGHTDLDRQKGLQWTDDVILSDAESPDDLPERFYQPHRPQIISAIWALSKTGHNMNLGKAPRQLNPQPIRVLESLQLPPAAIPAPSSGKDVPISAGNWNISKNFECD